MPAREPRDPDRAFYERSCDLWMRCGLSGWYVLIANASVVDFYETADKAMRCAHRATSHRTTLKRIPGERCATSRFKRPRAGEIQDMDTPH